MPNGVGMLRLPASGGAAGLAGRLRGPSSNFMDPRMGGFMQREPGEGAQGGLTPIGRGAPQQFLQQGAQAGYFSPQLPSSFLDPIIAQHVQDSQARQRRALLGAQLFGRGDPSMRGFASLQSLLGEGGNLARILGATRAESSMNQLRFLQDLLRDFGGVSFRGGFG